MVQHDKMMYVTFFSLFFPFFIQRENMATQNNYGLQSQRKSATSHEHEPSPSPTQESGQVRATHSGLEQVDLCQRFAKSIEDLLISCKNEKFRDECFKILGVENGSDAGIKTRELAMMLKDKRQNVGRGTKRKLNI